MKIGPIASSILGCSLVFVDFWLMDERTNLYGGKTNLYLGGSFVFTTSQVVFLSSNNSNIYGRTSGFSAKTLIESSLMFRKVP